MQWDGEAGAGFSAAEPWLPLSHDAATRNVDRMRDDPTSTLTLYRRLLALRREHEALSVGDYRGLPLGIAEVFAYERIAESLVLRIVLNFGGNAHAIPLPEGETWTVLLSTHGHRRGDAASGTFMLAPDEGLILQRG